MQSRGLAPQDSVTLLGLPVGRHTVSLSGATGPCRTSSGVDQVFDILPASMTRVLFSVTCDLPVPPPFFPPKGFLRLTVNAVGDSIPAAFQYTVGCGSSPACGPSQASGSIVPNQTTTVVLGVGGYQVTIALPRNCQAGTDPLGASARRSFRIATFDATPVTFSVTCH